MRWFWSPSGQGHQAVEPDGDFVGSTAPFVTLATLGDARDVLSPNRGDLHRLDFAHHIHQRLFDGNTVAPVARPKTILDVGCGTGLWATEMAEQFPEANVIGVDLMVPEGTNDPAVENCIFMPGNIVEGLSFASGSFEYVHQRLLFSSLPAGKWQRVVDELVRLTSAGGWIELVEGGIMSGNGRAHQMWRQWMDAVMLRRGIDLRAGSGIGAYLRKAGATDVTVREVQLPVGRAHGRIGALLEAHLCAVHHYLREPILRLGVVDEQSFDVTLAVMRDELAAGGHTWPVYVAYGRRPVELQG